VPRKGGGEVNVEFEKIDGAHEQALNAELRASGVMVRRLKNDVLKQLPPKHVFLVHLTPTAAIEELVREEATLYDMLETKVLTSQELMTLQGHIANVRQRLGVLKAPKIAEYVRWIFESGETRVVLFMLHLEAIEVVRKCFEHSRIKVRVMTGAEKPSVRQAHVNAFQREGGYELVVGQVVAAGVGLTMTAARYCVLGEIAWTPATNDQCVDRIHRLSQIRSVQAAICTFPHAVEERVIRANAKKAISARNILDVNLQNMFQQAAE
jgi:SNF2 family DNA or RNA helicase